MLARVLVVVAALMPAVAQADDVKEIDCSKIRVGLVRAEWKHAQINCYREEVAFESQGKPAQIINDTILAETDTARIQVQLAHGPESVFGPQTLRAAIDGTGAFEPIRKWVDDAAVEGFDVASFVGADNLNCIAFQKGTESASGKDEWLFGHYCDAKAIPSDLVERAIKSVRYTP